MRQALARLLDRTARRLGGRRSFDAAGGSGRWPLAASLAAPVSQSLAVAGRIGQRVDYLANNAPLAAAFVGTMETNLVPAAPTLRCQHPDPAVNQDVERRWRGWSMSCDAEGPGDLAAVLTKAARSFVVVGDAFTQMSIVDRQLRATILSAEQVDRAKTVNLPDGHKVFSGVEVDAAGRRVAYWLFPQQLDLPWATYQPSVRIDASDLLHMFIAKTPGALRGLSMLGPMATRALDVDRTEDASIMRANVAALFAGFIEDVDGSSSFMDPATTNPATGGTEIKFEPGTINRLPPNTRATFPNLPDQNGANDLIQHLVRSVASGGQMPAFLLSGNLAEINYSSGKLGMEQFKRYIGKLQQSHLIAQLVQPLYERWLTIEILSGRIAARDFESDPLRYLAVDWRWPAWPSLDPLKDARADDFALQNRTASRAEIIARRGRDISDVDREIAADPNHPKPSNAPVINVDNANA